MNEPQANPKPHAVDYISLALVAIGAITEAQDYLPAKYSGLIMLLGLGARLYTKWLGSQQQKDALIEGGEVGKEVKSDLNVINSKKPL